MLYKLLWHLCLWPLAASELPLKDLLEACGGDASGAPAVRFWQASQTLRLRRLKARVAPEVASSISFEFPKGLVVGQTAEACVLANGLWRLPIYRPRNSSGTADKGWVTLSAELSGGPRFLRPLDWKTLDSVVPSTGTPCGESALQVHLEDFWQQSAATVAKNDAATLGLETLQVPEGILHLNEDMFASLQVEPKKQDLWLVVSYTPWCKRCASYMENIVSSSKGKWQAHSRTHLASLNCFAHQKLCDSLGLMGHPMLGALGGAGLDEILDAWSFTLPAFEWRKDAAPGRWSFATEMSSLFALLPDEFQLDHESGKPQPSSRDRCPSPSSSETQLSGLKSVGRDWEEHEQATQKTPASGKSLVVADALQGLMASVEMPGDFLTLRQVAAVDAWLTWVQRQLPGTTADLNLNLKDYLSTPLLELKKFTTFVLMEAAVKGGHHTLCAADWEKEIRKFQKQVEATRELLLLPLRSVTSGRCMTRSCHLWTLLHGLSVWSDAAIDATTGFKVIAEMLQVTSWLSAWDPGANADAAMADPEFMASFFDADEEDALILALWRFHGAVTASKVFSCSEEVDLRWPPGSLCPFCWGRCFRQHRLCWMPWESQRQFWNRTAPQWVDASPIHLEVRQFLRSWYGGAKMETTS